MQSWSRALPVRPAHWTKQPLAKRILSSLSVLGKAQSTRVSLILLGTSLGDKTCPLSDRHFGFLYIHYDTKFSFNQSWRESYLSPDPISHCYRPVCLKFNFPRKVQFFATSLGCQTVPLSSENNVFSGGNVFLEAMPPEWQLPLTDDGQILKIQRAISTPVDSLVN